MLGAIVLRDVPKQEARIDLITYQTRGGFRGFQQVPPGLHYASVKAARGHTGFWCWLRPGEAVVRVFDPEMGFVRDDPETEARYRRLALGGAMNRALIVYDHTRFGHWFNLTRHLAAQDFPPTLNAEQTDGVQRSRFDRAFQDSHGGTIESFLAEFQFAFLRWLVSLESQAEDAVAFDRWQHLLLACYNVGEHRIRQSPALFPPLVQVLLAQFKLLPDEWFSEDSFLTTQVGYLIEDMIDTEIEPVVESARTLALYLKGRKEG